jgi:hypothetical protein
MKLLTLVTCLFTFIIKLIFAQQNSTSESASTLISQYGNSFKNQGGSILHDKVNGN